MSNLFDDLGEILGSDARVMAVSQHCDCDPSEMVWFDLEVGERGGEDLPAGFQCDKHQVFHEAWKFDPRNESGE